MGQGPRPLPGIVEEDVMINFLKFHNRIEAAIELVGG